MQHQLVTALFVAFALLACSDPATKPGQDTTTTDTPEETSGEVTTAKDTTGEPADGVEEAAIPDVALEVLGAEDTSLDGGLVLPMDDTLAINHVTVKGTHNSYHVQSDFFVTEEWLYTHAPLDVQLDELGVRQVELDVHYTDDGTFDVYHIPALDEGTTCGTFVGCLSLVEAWSTAHPTHELIFILVEPKDEVDSLKLKGHYDELDAAILSVFDQSHLLVPDDVRGDHETLREALEEDGWPTLGETRGKVMFIMLDSGEHRDGYLEGHPTLEGRVIFARGGLGEPYGAVIEYGNPVSSKDAIAEAVLAGYLVRTAADSVGDSDEDNAATAQAAIESGAHLISTDFPAPVEGQTYWFELPSGGPSMCNPLVAPDGCAPELIESLE